MPGGWWANGVRALRGSGDLMGAASQLAVQPGLGVLQRNWGALLECSRPGGPPIWLAIQAHHVRNRLGASMNRCPRCRCESEPWAVDYSEDTCETKSECISNLGKAVEVLTQRLEWLSDRVNINYDEER